MFGFLLTLFFVCEVLCSVFAVCFGWFWICLLECLLAVVLLVDCVLCLFVILLVCVFALAL